ncbi:DUF5107 domain-containing protein [bacterium]|nr:DUF5107 domain-containing protein [bacterium]
MIRSRRVVNILIGLTILVGVGAAAAQAPPAGAVKVYRGQVELASYEFSGRELEPTLFANSTLEGEYPLPPFMRPYKSETPAPRKYDAVFLENEYLRLTVVPDFGGRVYSLYDKVHGREVFYRNDVLKFSGVNPKHAWPVGDIEITGPHDHHMLTVDGEPYWFSRVRGNPDGSASLVLSSMDPYFRMKLDYILTLSPGLAALQLTVGLYNCRDDRQPYMLWVNAGVPATQNTRFVYPMGRTIGHTTSEVADWPYYNGVDYSWFKNNKHMLGVFGIDIYDNFLGAYDYNLDYGTFRYADRRITQGMKTWTWGNSRRAESIEHGYTDKAGPYIEIQSGRNVWDGHYEWLAPHTHEGWTECWFPVAGIGGLTTTTADLALNLTVSADPKGRKSSVRLGLSPNRVLAGARVSLSVAGAGGERVLFEGPADLAPGKPFVKELKNLAADSAALCGMRVRVTGGDGAVVLDYRRPDRDPGHCEYTPFTSQLEKTRKTPDQMSAEELVLEAETRIEEMHAETGAALLRAALERDPGYSRAHLGLGLWHLDQENLDSAVVHLSAVVDRDPYNQEAYYYLSRAQLAAADSAKAERNLYFIPPTAGLYAQREYSLGQIAFRRGGLDEARAHLEQAVAANGTHLYARDLLALTCRLSGLNDQAREQLDDALRLDPTDRWALAERAFLGGEQADRAALDSLLGGQSQESLELASVYRDLYRWSEALAVLEITERVNHDPYGAPAIFWYTKALCLRRLGRDSEAGDACRKGSESRGNVDRFPFRRESREALAEAIVYNPSDVTARYLLGCLQYFLRCPDEAIAQWQAAVELAPDDFSLRRSLGLALAEQGRGMEAAAGQLEAAIRLNPEHTRTFADLSLLYSREGAFDRQLALLERAIQRSPEDDYLVEGLLTAHLVAGHYSVADSLIQHHVFEQRHRDYSLRDKYRFLRYAVGAQAFQRGGYAAAKSEFERALYPPSSLGADDFQYQNAPRVHYYLGRTLAALGQSAQAQEEYRKAVSGWESLKGDRDSYNSENFFIIPALRELGQKDDADRLLGSMQTFAAGELDKKNRYFQAEAHYLVGLALKSEGRASQAHEMFDKAIAIDPTLLGPRLELRGDVIDPLKGN